MTYNIVDDEISWKKWYSEYLHNLSNQDLLKELRFVIGVDKDFKNIYQPKDYEDLYDMRIRLDLICKILETKLIETTILSEEEYKQLLSETMREEMEENICSQ